MNESWSTVKLSKFSESSESDDDSYADLDSDAAEEEDDDIVEKTEQSQSKKTVKVTDPVKAQKKQELMEAAKKELPYTFKGRVWFGIYRKTFSCTTVRVYSLCFTKFVNL